MIQLVDMPNELICQIGEGLDSHNLNSLIKANRHFAAVLTPVLNKSAIRDLPGKLFEAASHGYEHLTRLLLDNGADVNAKDSSMARTALALAAREQRVAVVKLLLEKGADVSARDIYRNSVLCLAVPRRRRACLVKEVVKLLLDHGADVDTKSGANQVTMLCLAAQEGYLPLVRLLLERGADTAARDCKGNTALTNAVEFMTRSHDKEGVERLGEIIKLLLDNGGDMNSPNINGMTPFFLAAAANTNALKFLLNLEAQRGGPDISFQNTKGHTVLHVAMSESPCIENLKLLLERGVDVGATDFRGKTALHLFAASRGSNEVGQLLIDSGVDLFARNSYGDTAFHSAVTYGGCRKVLLFLENGADANALNNLGDTPLRSAVRRCNKSIVSIILDKRFYTDVLANYSEGTLAIAVAKGCSEIVKLLLEKGIDTTVQRKKNYGRISLYHAVKDGDDGMVALLLEAGVDIGYVDSTGNTVLHCAARSGYQAVVKMLLENGAGTMLGFENVSGVTAARVAIINGHTSVAELLVWNFGTLGASEVELYSIWE